MTIHQSLYLFFPLASLYRFSFSTPSFSLSFPYWYACVTGNLQFRWRYRCLYLANFTTGLKLEDMLLNEFLFLLCHVLIPSNLFSVRCKLPTVSLCALGVVRCCCSLLYSMTEHESRNEDMMCNSTVGIVVTTLNLACHS